MFSSVTSLGDHAPIPASMTRSATVAQNKPSLGHGRWPSYGSGGGWRGQKLSLDTATATDVVSGKTRTVIREVSCGNSWVGGEVTDFGLIALANCGHKGVFQELVTFQ
jgi:hypothetical protein